MLTIPTPTLLSLALDESGLTKVPPASCCQFEEVTLINYGQPEIARDTGTEAVSPPGEPTASAWAVHSCVVPENEDHL